MSIKVKNHLGRNDVLRVNNEGELIVQDSNISINTDSLETILSNIDVKVSTSSKQDTMINLLEGQTPALNRTHAIPVQIMVGDAGGNYDALRANGQDLLVKIDDMDPDCAVNSGLSTSAKQDTTHFLLGLLATKAEQLNQSTNLINIDNSTANIDGKILKSNVIASDGTTSVQTVQICGSNDGTNLRTVKTDGNGSLIVDVSADAVISSNGITEEQRVMICGSNDGTNLRTVSVYDTGELRSVAYGEDSLGDIYPVKVSDSGTLQMEIDHTWKTNLLGSYSLTAGSGNAILTDAVDIGNGKSHEYTRVQFFLTNSAGISVDIQGQASYDGTNWYTNGKGTSLNSNQINIYFCQSCLDIGDVRYMRLRVVNNTATASTITVNTGIYDGAI